MRKISLYVNLLIVLAFFSCGETPTSNQDNNFVLEGRVIINTNGIDYYDNITDVTVSIGKNKTNADSSGYWKLEGKFEDIVDIVFQKPNYSYYTAQDVVLLEDQWGKYKFIILYNLPNYSVTTFNILPVERKEYEDQYLDITIDYTPPSEYPDIKKCIIFFNSDSIISPNPTEYLFAQELYGPAQFVDYWIPSDQNKIKYHLSYHQTIYAIAFPASAMEYIVDKATGKKQYTCIGSGKSNLIKFSMP